jgi:hypothetical protein
MQGTPIPNFCGPTYQHRGVDVDCEICLNLYPEFVESNGARANSVLISRPGRVVERILNGPVLSGCKGVHTTAAGRTFAVSGANLFEVTALSDIDRGSVGFSTWCTFCDNGEHLLVATGYALYSFDLNTAALSSVPDSPVNPSHVLYLSQRAICNDGYNNKWRYSKIGDMISWPALNVKQAEGSADDINSLCVVAGEVWLYGKQSFEAWAPDGSADTNYTRRAGSFSGIGCAAPYSLAVILDHSFWVGGGQQGQGIVYMSDGYNAKRISNHAIENALSSDVASMIGFGFQIEGHWFYVLTGQSIDRTFVYDTGSGDWWEASDMDFFTGENHCWDCVGATYGIGDKLIMGSLSSPGIYHVSLDTYSDEDIYFDGSSPLKRSKPIRRVRQLPVSSANGSPLVFRWIAIDLESGVGTVSGDDADPVMLFKYSDDGGHVFSKQRDISLGKIGQYMHRGRVCGLGYSRKRVFHFSITGAFKVIFINAFMGAAEVLRP